MIQLSCFHMKSSGVPIYMKRLDAGANNWIRQNEKDKKTFCSACMCYGLILTLCMDKEVCLFLCMEGRFVLLPQCGNGCWHWNWGHVTVVTIHGVCLRQRDSLEAWKVASSQLMEFVVFKCWSMVQQRCFCVIHALLHFKAYKDGTELPSTL